MTDQIDDDLEQLPSHILGLGRRRGNEYAWPLNAIPFVIEAARVAGLLNVGGQLQFWLPDGGICECYWIEVDTYRTTPTDLTWPERVERAAAEAQSAFALLLLKDLIAEGRKEFAGYLDAIESEGGDLVQAMKFVWYSNSCETEMRLTRAAAT
jgi:hypothetical protein